MAIDTATTIRRFAAAALLAAAATVVPSAATEAQARVVVSSSGTPPPVAAVETQRIEISYVAHTGATRNAVVLVPQPYDGEPLPLVVSPHGRALDGSSNAKLWGELPGLGRFAVVSPDGQGNRFGSMSWGAPGQIDDLARMPEIVAEALPHVRIDRSRIYAFGGSMGGHESLLLVARHPRLLAGAASFDGVADFALQYENFKELGCNDVCRRVWHGTIGSGLRQLARREVGGTPADAPEAWAERSPITYARAIAFSCVPVQIWWGTKAKIVREPDRQSGRLLALVRWLNPSAPVEGFVGRWIHTASFRAKSRLPLALARFGLMPSAYGAKPPLLRHEPAGGGC